MSSNPFVPAAAVTPRVKALFYGGPGVGKSHLAVEAAIKLAAAEGKRCAALSLEGGLEYLPSKGFDFDNLATKSYADVLSAVDFLLSPQGQQLYGAIVIDPVTVAYQIVQEAQQDIVERRAVRKGKSPEEEVLGYREWGQVKKQMDKLATRLVNAPQHVFVTAREAVEYESRGNNLTAVGFKPECHKSWPFLFDVMLRITVARGARTAEVQKDRFSFVGQVGDLVSEPSAKLFDFAAGTTGKWKRICDIAAAAAEQADEEVAPLATDEQMEEIESQVSRIEELDEAAGTKARTWWTEKRVSVAMSREVAEKASANLRKQLDKLEDKLEQAVAA
jgi:hypothetical protein